MKILLITPLYPKYNGQSRQEISYALHYLAKDWIKLGHEVEVMRICPRYPLVFNLSKEGGKNRGYRNDSTFDLEGVEVNRLMINKFPKVDYFKKDIKDVCNRIITKFKKAGDNQPDIIVCHMTNPYLYISKLLKEKLDIPLVLTLHQSDIHQISNYKNLREKYTSSLQFIDKIGFRSVKLMDKYKKMDLPLKRSFVIHSGIDKKLVISDFKLQKKIYSPSKIIFIAASMIPLKNIDTLIRAFEKIAVDNDIYLKIAGDGSEKENLLKQAKNSLVKDKISFLGYVSRENVIKSMEKSDIFVMASSPETFGLVYIEAMSKGCITIGSKGEGIDGVIVNEENGFLCEPRNINDLASVLLKVLNLSSEQKRKVITNAVSTAKSMTQESISKEYLNVLLETVTSYQHNKEDIN